MKQYIGAGLVDEIQIHLVPVFLGEGVRCLTARCCPRSRSDKSGRWKPPEWPTSRIEYGGLPSGKPRGSPPPPRASRTTRVGPRRAVPSAGDVRAGGVAIGARHLRELRAGGKREGGLCETGNPPRSAGSLGPDCQVWPGFPHGERSIERARRAMLRYHELDRAPPRRTPHTFPDAELAGAEAHGDR